MACMTGLFADKVIVIIGAGPGFGRTLALEAAREGATVVVAARTQERLDQLADEITQVGGRAIAAAVDATDPDSVRALRETVEQHTDAVHGLVNSAFAVPSMKPLAKTDHAQITAGIDLSVMGALRATQEFTPLLEAGDGSGVMMASAVIHHSRERYAGYKIAKTALVALGHSLATELGPRGIRVNTVGPACIRTPLQDSLPQEVQDQLATKHVLGRTGEPQEVRRWCASCSPRRRLSSPVPTT